MPCAGLSTRFPNLRPKYLLTDYNGKLMIENAAKNFIDKYRVTVVILEEHDKKFNARQKLNDAFGYKIDIIILDKPTTGPADTVYQAIKRGRINTNSPILIKDCDGFYDADIVDGNAIYVSKLSKNPDIRNAPAKSYTITNEQNIITTVVEKQIVSNSFCVGGYQFASAKDYIEAFETLKDTEIKSILEYIKAESDKPAAAPAAAPTPPDIIWFTDSLAASTCGWASACGCAAACSRSMRALNSNSSCSCGVNSAIIFYHFAVEHIVDRKSTRLNSSH